MASPDAHLDWALENERFADRLNLSNPIEAGWAITAIFYAALHYVQAYFVSQGDPAPRTHVQRDSRIQDSAALGAIWPHYRRLKDMSRDARYDLVRFGEADYVKARNLLEKVRTNVWAYRGKA